MNSTNQNIVLAGEEVIRLREHQGQKGFPDSGRDGIERQNNLCHDDTLLGSIGVSMLGCKGEADATADLFDLGEFRREGVQNVVHLDDWDLVGKFAHPHSAMVPLDHAVTNESRGAATNRQHKADSWLTPSHTELFLEQMMEETDRRFQCLAANSKSASAMELSFGSIIHRASIPNEGADQNSTGNRAQDKYPEFNQCSASEGESIGLNRATTSLASEPMDCADRPVAPPIPHGAVTNSTGALNSAGARKIPAGFFSPTFSFTSFISKNSHRLVSDLDNHSHSKREFAGAQESFEGRNDA